MEIRSTFKIVTGKPTEKKLIERPRGRSKDNIRIGLKEIGVITRKWIHSDQNKEYLRDIMNTSLKLHYT